MPFHNTFFTTIILSPLLSQAASIQLQGPGILPPSGQVSYATVGSGFAETATGLYTTIANSSSRPLLYANNLCFNSSQNLTLGLSFTINSWSTNPFDLGQIALGLFNTSNPNDFIYTSIRPQDGFFGLGGYTINQNNSALLNSAPLALSFVPGTTYNMQLSLSGLNTSTMMGTVDVTDSAGNSVNPAGSFPFTQTITPISSSHNLCLMFGVDDAEVTLHSAEAIPEPTSSVLLGIGALGIFTRRRR